MGDLARPADFGDTKVNQFHFALRRKLDIGRLDVAVDDRVGLRVEIGQSIEQGIGPDQYRQLV